jgi:hypothetical protein
MRPRIAFATLLALASVLHLVLLVSPPRSVSALAIYVCWLLPSAAFAVSLWVKSSAHTLPASMPDPRIRRTRSEALWMEGLGLFVLIASVGLLIHCFGPTHPDRQHRAWTAERGFALMVVLSAAGCWALLRGAPGDTTAPIPDGSRLVHALGWLRRSVGIALGCSGAWLLFLGVRHWGQPSDGFDRLLNLMFVVTGPALMLIGSVIALRRGRGDD